MTNKLSIYIIMVALVAILGCGDNSSENAKASWPPLLATLVCLRWLMGNTFQKLISMSAM